MQQRPLGNTGLILGEVGLGCWQFGGNDWGPMSDDQAEAVMHAAVEHGATLFDTADVYGAGRSETLIGQFLRKTAAPVHVITKLGRESRVYPDNYTEETLQEGVDSSLKRLGLEALDLLQLHCIPSAILHDGAVFDWLRRLQRQGKIKRFGASVESVDEALLCMEQEGLATLQIILNIFRQKPVAELLPKAKDKNIGIIVRLPLASGLLAGKFTIDTQFAETDHRTYNRDGQYFNVGETFAGLPFSKAVSLTDTLKQWVPEGMTLAQMAMRWLLDFDAVSVVIPGASSPQQAVDNACSSDLPPLSETLHQRLAEFYRTEVHEHIRGVY